MEDYDLVLENPRDAVFFAGIHAMKIMGKMMFSLEVNCKLGGRYKRYSEPYRTERGAKIAYSRKFQPLEYYEQPKWKKVNE